MKIKMKDPRENSAKRVIVNNGKVEGTALDILYPSYNTKYKLLSVSVLGEEQSKGQTIAKVFVTDTDNIPRQPNIRLMWPYTELANRTLRFANFALPGNSNYPIEHVISNGFDPNRNSGPLAIGIYERNTLVSPIVAGLGLPWNRHISFNIVYSEGNSEEENNEETIQFEFNAFADDLIKLLNKYKS